MRVLFTFVGGHGHFEPLVRIARAAEAAGHTVAFGCGPSMVSTFVGGTQRSPSLRFALVVAMSPLPGAFSSPRKVELERHPDGPPVFERLAHDLTPRLPFCHVIM